MAFLRSARHGCRRLRQRTAQRRSLKPLMRIFASRPGVSVCEPHRSGTEPQHSQSSVGGSTPTSRTSNSSRADPAKVRSPSTCADRCRATIFAANCGTSMRAKSAGHYSAERRSMGQPRSPATSRRQARRREICCHPSTAGLASPCPTAQFSAWTSKRCWRCRRRPGPKAGVAL